jgi:hypothetical protein
MPSFTGTFTRVTGDSVPQIPPGWFTVSHHWVTPITRRRLGHGRWHKITAPGGYSVYRLLRFSTTLPGTPTSGSGHIVIDWIGWIDLNGRSPNVTQPLNLTVEEAPWWKWLSCAWSHPDQTFKIVIGLAVISIVLSVISTAASVFSIFWHPQ